MACDDLGCYSGLVSDGTGLVHTGPRGRVLSMEGGRALPCFQLPRPQQVWPELGPREDLTSQSENLAPELEVRIGTNVLGASMMGQGPHRTEPGDHTLTVGLATTPSSTAITRWAAPPPGAEICTAQF